MKTRGSLRRRGKLIRPRIEQSGRELPPKELPIDQRRRKEAPLSFALSDSEADGSNRSGSGTHHSTSPLNTIIPNEAELTTGGDGLILEFVNRTEEDTYHNLNNDTHNVRNEPAHTHASGLTGHGVSSSSGGSHRQAFPKRNPGGDDIGSSLRGDVGFTVPFILAWNLTTHSILNDVEFCQDMMINLATPAVRDQQNRLSDYQALQHLWFELGRGALAQINILQRYEVLNEYYGELYESHRSCQDVSDRLTETQNQLVDIVRSQNKLYDDHKALQQVHLGCVSKEADLTEKLAVVEKERDDLLDKNREREERIKQLEADLASKTSSLIEAEGAVSTLKAASHCLQRLLSSDKYKKSLFDVFNLAIATGWSEGVKAACSKEVAEAFLATAIDYDPACKTTFMSEFDYIFNKSYSYVEKLVESFSVLWRD
ncbi:hypothetical protein Tco_0846662 [Tanacetum coccineum]